MVLIGCTAQQPAPVVPQPPPAPVVLVAKPPEPPKDATPKLRLPRTFDPKSYAARLKIDPDQSTFDGHIEISGELKTASTTLWLHGWHFQIAKAILDGGAVPIELHVAARGEDLLELTADAALPPGTYKLTIDYTGVIDTVNTTGMFTEKSDGASYVFSQFEALYARRVFPCIDEPDEKVPWQLTIDAPKGQLAVSNTPVVKESDVGNRHVTEFAQTKPLPTYLIAFGVGPFEIVPAGATKGGTPVRIIALKGHAAQVAYAAKTTAKSLELLEARFGIPYPYPKLDILTIPLTAGFGAMENAGLITYTSALVENDAKPSWLRRATWVVVSSHEMAHQWFGDLVTTAWWDDIWLNEGFANWMEGKVTADFDPSWHFEAHALSMRDEALEADSRMSARQIRQPIAVQGDILNVFDGITYNKGASILNMFEAYVGSEVFQRGVTQYLKDRAYGNATSTDFIAAVSKASGKELAPAFATFLDQPGEPELTATLECSGGAAKVALTQKRFIPAGSPTPAAEKPWIFPVCLAYERDGKRAETCALLDAPTGSVPLKSCPRWVMPNANGHGYYRVHYTTKQASALRDEAWAQLSTPEKRAVFSDVAVEAMESTDKLPLPLALSFVPKLIGAEDPSALGDARSFAEKLDPFVPDDLRAKQQAWYRATFGPGAAKAGLVAKDNDDFTTEISREQFIASAGLIGLEPELVKQAKELSGHWRELPQAIRDSVLIMAMAGDPDRVAQLIKELRTEPKREYRRALITALAAQRDSKSYPATLEVTLDPALDLREATAIVFWPETEANRALAEAFYRAHGDELTKRLPKDEVTGTLAGQVHLFTGACDGKTRDDRAAEVTKRFANEPGGARVVAQAIEAMDQCIATRAVLEPEVRGWLGGVKVQKPVPQKPVDKTVEKTKSKKPKSR